MVALVQNEPISLHDFHKNVHRTPYDAFVGETYSPHLFKDIIYDFIQKFGHLPPTSFELSDIKKTSTYRTMFDEFLSFNHDDRFYEDSCITAAVIAEQGYPQLSSDKKLQIAKYTWHAVTIEDSANKILPHVKAFQEDFFRRRISENALLASFQQNLLNMYNWWDPIAANLITISALDFITGLLMEEDPAYQGMQLSDAALAWPDFLRRQTGSAVAYACMLFPKDSCSDTSTYIQVVEDMAYIVNILNDLLSYHKEALIGDCNNYVHFRARVNGKTVLETLKDVAEDILAANERIIRVLQSTSPESIVAWRNFVYGYSDFHFCSPRYRLKDFNLASE
ncbi:hypothetical protein CVT26_010374 [Gymnopilus dilepis]|uniref:Terpene synthase n=1 Tax=Gymnopilus dilepis TaxID=231916 RepID=A0A409WRZ6_9AGAR|nr:hypothetical protein CVT26_010374 [Gymnopilus dilepis]